ncbi:hypothetical protein [Ornithinimicrobium panacihumi]|uniref:hypothetical protein n=1 Tax=Ornithinimicrobium panacihumi TaxID=2008449 RepID=UPI003F8A0C7A
MGRLLTLALTGTVAAATATWLGISLAGQTPQEPAASSASAVDAASTQTPSPAQTQIEARIPQDRSTELPDVEQQGPGPQDLAPDHAPAGTPVSRPAPAPVHLPQEAAEEAESVVGDFLAAQDEFLGLPEPGLLETDALGVVTGVAEGELAARAAEFANEGLRQTGQVQVLGVTILDRDDEADPATMTVEACLDLDDVEVVDARGVSLGDRLYRPGRPVRDVYTLVRSEGSWKVTFHEIPADDACTPTT